MARLLRACAPTHAILCCLLPTQCANPQSVYGDMKEEKESNQEDYLGTESDKEEVRGQAGKQRVGVAVRVVRLGWVGLGSTGAACIGAQLLVVGWVGVGGIMRKCS